MLGAGHVFWAVAVLMFVWGAFNSSIPVSRSAWLAEGISDAPETGGGLIVAAIQLAIMLGALLDHLSIAATFIGGAVLLISASLVVGNGERLKASS
jgi:predicted MFS family arabinose efflux permease